MEDVQIKEEVDQDTSSSVVKDCSVVLVKEEIDDDLIDNEFDEQNYDEQDLESSEDDYEDDDEDDEYESDDSDFEYKSKKRRKSASEKDSSGTYNCASCHRTFRSQPNLNKHLGHFENCRKHYEDIGSLPLCFSSQAGSRTASKHKKQNDSEDTGDYACNKCHKRFISEGGLNRHVSKIKACKKYYDGINGLDQISTVGLTARQSYYARNREKVIARQRAYYQRNAHKVKERRVQHYRSKIVASLLESGDLHLNKKGTGYMERHKEYYEKNKEVIKERRRNYYHFKKEALSRKVGRFEFAKISAVKNLAEIPDPFEAYGQVKINIPPPLPPIKALKKKTRKNLDQEDQEDEENDELSSISNTSPLTNCTQHPNADKGTKIQHLEESDDGELTTMPTGTKLSAKPFDYHYIQNVESFVGLTLSPDGESIEVCPLLERNNITLETMRKLIHALLSVLSIDLKTFVQEKSCPVHLFEVKHMHLLKDKLTRDLLKVNNVLPEATRPLCNPVSSTETDFLDEGMSEDIPHDQLLVNENLVASDLGAVGVQWRLPNDQQKIRINPLFSINSVDHWRFRLRHFYTLLVNWVGGKVTLNQIFHMLPCMITAKESFFDEVRLALHRS